MLAKQVLLVSIERSHKTLVDCYRERIADFEAEGESFAVALGVVILCVERRHVRAPAVCIYTWAVT